MASKLINNLPIHNQEISLDSLLKEKNCKNPPFVAVNALLALFSFFLFPEECKIFSLIFIRSN